jgi:hypothetical protein
MRCTFPQTKCGVTLLMVLMMMVCCGCDKPEFPTTFPVKGKVLLAGDKPLSLGTIEFECVAQPEYRGFCRIAMDGTFGPVMVYKSNGRETAGLTAGEYRVRVIPHKDDESRGADPFPKRFQEFAESGLTITVVAPDNDVTVRIDPSKAGTTAN